MSLTPQLVRKVVLRPAAAGLCLMAVCSAQPSAAAQPGFSFRQAEFMGQDAATRSATSFVATELPPGLSMTRAVRRLTRADMECRPGASAGVTACSFDMVAGRDGGTTGDDVWTVHLHNHAGKLTAARLIHQRTGFMS